MADQIERTDEDEKTMIESKGEGTWCENRRVKLLCGRTDWRWVGGIDARRNLFEYRLDRRVVDFVQRQHMMTFEQMRRRFTRMHGTWCGLSQFDQRCQHRLVQLLHRTDCIGAARRRLDIRICRLTRIAVVRRFRYAAVFLVVQRVVAALVLDAVVALTTAQGEEHAQNDDQDDERHSHLLLRVIAARIAIDANCELKEEKEMMSKTKEMMTKSSDKVKRNACQSV